MDTIVFELLFGLARRPLLTDITAVIAQWGSVAAIFVIAGYFIWRGVRANHAQSFRNVALALVSAVIARFGVVDLLRLLAPRPRPFVVESFKPLIEHAASPSFPSGHVTFLAALAVYFLLIGFLSVDPLRRSFSEASKRGRAEKITGWLFLILALLVGVSRVAVGVHWPTDILAGWLVGALVSSFVWYFTREKRGQLSNAMDNVK